MATIKNEREKKLQATTPRFVATSVAISPSTIGFKKPKNGAAITSGGVVTTQITLSTYTTIFTIPIFKWEYKTSNGSWTIISGAVSSSYVLTSANFITFLGTGQYLSFRCTATQTNYSTALSPTVDITYTVEADDPILVEQTMPVATVGADSGGAANNFTTTANSISVKRGGVALAYGTSANQFTVSYTSQTAVSGIGTITVPAGSGASNTFTIGVFSAMSTTLNTATILYTISIKDLSGVATTQTITQTVNKVNSGAGADGVAAILVHLTNNAAVVYTDNLGANANYASTPTGIYVYEGNTKLNYASSGTVAGTFTIDLISVSSITCGTISGVGGDHAIVATATNITSDVASITFTITAYRYLGGSTTLSAIQAISRNKTGESGTSYWVSSSVAALSKNAALVYNPLNVTFTAYKNVNQVTSSPVSWFKIYEMGVLKYTTAAGGETFKTHTPTTTSVTSITCEMYLNSGCTVLADTEGVSVVNDGATGASPCYINVTGPTLAFTRATSSGTFSPASLTLTLTPFNGTASGISWYKDGVVIGGQTATTLSVANSASTTSSTYKAVATVGGVSCSDETAVIWVTGGANGVTPIYGYLTNPSTVLNCDLNGNSYTIGNTAGIFKVFNGTTEVTGAAVTYSVVGSPTNCTMNTITASTGAYSLATISSGVSVGASATLRAVYSGVTIDCRLSVAKSSTGATGAPSTVPGPTGATAVFAYQIVTGTSLPSAPTITVNTAPSAGAATTGSWYLSPKLSLAANDWQFQVSGTLSGSTYTWSTLTGYLSTFKVGQLSALSANMGAVQIDSTGKVYAGKTTYATAADGFFLGYDSTAYKFIVGNSAGTKSLSWNGTDLAIKGNIDGTSSINISGFASFAGSSSISTPFGTLTACSQFNSSAISDIAVYATTIAESSATAVILASGTLATTGAVYGVVGYGTTGILGQTSILATPPGSYGVEGRANLDSDSAVGVHAKATSALAYPLALTYVRTGTPGTPGTVNGWIPVKVNGTLSYIPYYR